MRLLKILTTVLALVLTIYGTSAVAQSEFRSMRFPLRVANNQFLEDASGKPVSLFGEAAWSLIVAMKREEVSLYLNDRKNRGFNAILVNLIENKFAVNPPANIYGEKPFLGKTFGDFNSAYFDHAEWVVKQAQDAGLVVFLTPAYLGVSGADEGWYSKAVEAGPAVMKSYGKTVATRFAKYPNIVWVMGGDFDPPEKEILSNIAEGIKSVLPDAIMTVHGGRNSVPTEVWPNASWLSIDTVYDYDAVHQSVLDQTEHQTKPVVLLETLYEGERETSAQTIRMNAYGALLAGAAGQFFGNSPVWHFDAPGVFSTDSVWHQRLDTEGAQSISYLRQLYEMIGWDILHPDRTGTITAREDLFGARTSDKQITLIYGATDSGDGFVVKNEALPTDYQALWFDPSSGRFAQARTAPINNDLVSYTPPASRNAGNGTDWLLIIGSRERLKSIQKE